MKITQFGLRYSPNLGDGVIAECIGHGLRTRHPAAQVTHVDLSGRANFGAVVVRNRELLLAILDHLPLWARQRLTLWKLGKLVTALEPAWRAAANCDLAVIGGGQILSDAHLNFPIKVGQAAKLLAQSGTPTALYAVGASRNWTPRGQALFAQLLQTDLRLVAPRDAHSQEAWSTQISGGPAPEIILDPGLLAADCYGSIDRVAGQVGVCVTDFALLRHHADSNVAGQASDPVSFYAGLVRGLRDQGRPIQLFTNGAAEDRILKQRVAAALGPIEEVSVPDDPARPSALVAQIAACDMVVAHRLHACIVAYAYGRGIVGLGWDRKLQSFFETVDMGHGFTGAPDISAPQVLALVEEVERRGLDTVRHQQTIARAWQGIDRLLACAREPAAR